MYHIVILNERAKQFDKFIKLLSPNYELTKYRIKENLIVFEIRSTVVEPKCPYCGLKVDDFAPRKRFLFGTVMVNLESHRMLATFPNIQGYRCCEKWNC